MNVLLTGPPGVGKSTIIRKVVAVITQYELRITIGGFLTEELRERQQRLGFQVVALDTHEVSVLAQVKLGSPYRIGKYGVRLEAMNEVAIPAIHRALVNADVIVVDEIGRMECFAPDFLVAVIACLDSSKPLLGAVSQHRLPFLDAVRDRDDVELIETTV